MCLLAFCATPLSIDCFRVSILGDTLTHSNFGSCTDTSIFSLRLPLSGFGIAVIEEDCS